MMAFKYTQISSFKYVGMAICLLLGACDSSTQTKNTTSSQGDVASVKVVADSAQENTVDIEDGKRLTEVAGRTALPRLTEPESIAHSKKMISKASQAYVGRYHLIIDCSEKFALCDKGKAEFVISLLADGTSHRTIVYLGKMSHEARSKPSSHIYQQNTWTFNPKTDQIEVKRKEGVNFYYHVNPEGNLVIDLDSIYANNKVENGQLIDGTYVPTKAYVLKKLETKN